MCKLFNRRFFSLLIVLGLGFLLSACTPSETFEHAEGSAVTTKSKMEEEKNMQMKEPPPVVRKAAPYVDVKPISLDRDPGWFHKDIEVHGNDLPFTLFASKIMEGLPVAVNFHASFNKYQLVSMDYNGNVKGALDLLAAKTGSMYRADHNRLRWTDMITRTYNVSFMPGQADYVMGSTSGKGSSSAGGSGSGGGSGGGSNIQQVTATTAQDGFSNLKGTVSVWTDLEKTIANMLSKDGKSVVSQATTSVTVTDHIENVQAVDKYLTQLNENLSRQVLLKVVVLDVALDQAYSYGVNWNLLRNQFGKNWHFSGDFSSPIDIGATAGIGAFSIFLDKRSAEQAVDGSVVQATGNHLSTSRSAGSDVLIKALETQGRVSVVTRPEVVTLNNQVAEIAIINQTAYLASITTTLSEGQSQTSLEPGIVTAGFSLYVLPKIQDKKVYLQITTSLSNLVDIKTQSSGGTDSAAIQVPELAEKYFNQRTMLQSGECLILSGFKSLKNNAAKNQNFGSDVLGGKGATRSNIETLVLITPYVMGGHHDPHVTAMRPIDSGMIE